MIDWNKRNGGFLAPESVYEDQLGNLSMQINQKDKEIERLNNIINEIKKVVDYYGITPDVNDDATTRHILKSINDKLELKEGKE